MAANSEVVAGVASYILFAEESTYGTAVTPTTIFGGLVQRASFGRDRNVQERAGFTGGGVGDGRKTAAFVPGTYAGKASVEFTAQRWDWLQYLLLGTRTGSGTGGSPYSYPIGVTKRSITLTEEIDNVGTDSERIAAGAVLNSATISCSVGEAVNVSVDIIYGKEAYDTAITAKVAQLTDAVYTFAGGSLEIVDGTPIGNVIDSIELTISNNYELAYGFGAYSAVNAKPGKLNITLRFTTKYLDDDQLAMVLGGTDSTTAPTVNATAALKFTKGSSYVDFVFTNLVLHRNDSSHDLNAWVMETNETISSLITVGEVQ